MEKEPKNFGNQNAKKEDEEVKSSPVSITTTEENKKKWKACAKKEGRSLSSWCGIHLCEVANSYER